MGEAFIQFASVADTSTAHAHRWCLPGRCVIPLVVTGGGGPQTKAEGRVQVSVTEVVARFPDESTNAVVAGTHRACLVVAGSPLQELAPAACQPATDAYGALSCSPSLSWGVSVSGTRQNDACIRHPRLWRGGRGTSANVTDGRRCCTPAWGSQRLTFPCSSPCLPPSLPHKETLLTRRVS